MTTEQAEHRILTGFESAKYVLISSLPIARGSKTQGKPCWFATLEPSSLPTELLPSEIGAMAQLAEAFGTWPGAKHAKPAKGFCRYENSSSEIVTNSPPMPTSVN